MEEDFGGYHPTEIDKKWRGNQNTESETRSNSAPSAESYTDIEMDDPKKGAYTEMTIDGFEREYVDAVAEDFNVNLDYGEGKIEVYGPNTEEIRDFRDRLESSENKVVGPDHPVSSIMENADFSAFSALEPSDEVDRGKGAVPDGGSEDYQTMEDVSHTPPDYDGVQESMKRGDDTSGIPLTGVEHASGYDE